MGSSNGNPFTPFFERQGTVILDGGLATELEAQGADLGDTLWSARLLRDDPAAIVRAHRAFLDAGADVVTTATYQATFEGFASHGLSAGESEALLLRGVALGLEARDTFWGESETPHRLRPLVAASVGPYGAYLADGSEYRGDYGLSARALVEFHRRRFELLATAGADVLACETIPSLDEGLALARLLRETPTARGWITFSCADDRHLADGTPFTEAVAALDTAADGSLLAVGVNCTAPRHVAALLTAAARVTARPLVAYPNSGEGWDAAHKRWLPTQDPVHPAALATHWTRGGARLVGGCCRTTPGDIRTLRHRLLTNP